MHRWSLCTLQKYELSKFSVIVYTRCTSPDEFCTTNTSMYKVRKMYIYILRRRRRWISEGSWPSLWRHGVALGAIRGGHKMPASSQLTFVALPNIHPTFLWVMAHADVFAIIIDTALLFHFDYTIVIVTGISSISSSSSLSSSSSYSSLFSMIYHQRHLRVFPRKCRNWALVRCFGPKLPALCVWARAKIVRNTRQKKWQILDRNTDRCQYLGVACKGPVEEV